MNIPTRWLALGLALAPLSVGAVRATHAPETHVVEMVLRDGAYRFSPEKVQARTGDRVTFVLRGGGPHNVAFDAEKIPDAVEAKLSAGLPNRMSALAGPLVSAEGASYTVSLAGVPAGTYPFFCMPHMGVGMTGTLQVVE